MADRTNEDADLGLVEELVSGPAGFVLERIETTQELRPDFRMVSWRGLAGYCEVKSPRDDWLDEQLEQAPPGTIVGGARTDPTFNRIARHILKAVKQLDTVNPDHALPNVLVFVNHDDHSNFNDLCETVTGYARAASGERYPFHLHIAEQRLGDKRGRIDLYLWIDDNRKRRRISGFLWCDTNSEHVAALRTLMLNILPEKVETRACVRELPPLPAHVETETLNTRSRWAGPRPGSG